MLDYMNEIEKRLMPYVETGEVTRLLVRAPRSFGNLESFNSGVAIVVLNDWGQRRNGFVIMDEVRKKLADLPGVRATPVMRQGFGGAVSKPVQFVIQGSNYEELQAWRDILQAKIQENNPGLEGVDFDYKETRPQMEINIDTLRAADLGVDIQNISRTLETFFSSRRVTTYIDRGEEYDVILKGEAALSQRISDIQNLYVRNDRGQLISLSQLVTIQEFADAAILNRYNRLRAITLEANLAEGYTLGEALNYLNNLVREHLPETAAVDYKGQSKDYMSSNQSFLFIFLLGVVIVYLVLAAQFESFVHPFVVLLTVPLAVLGALGGLWLTSNSLNLYSQIGLVMLVGLSTKNGILIVEFINQLRDEGMAFFEAIVEASVIRLRPIVMTAITTVIGAIPLLLSSGPGAETRAVVGLVIFYGVLFATFLTLLVIPVAYRLLAFRTGSPEATAKRLAAALKEQPLQ
jgi:multidrug efflux pump